MGTRTARPPQLPGEYFMVSRSTISAGRFTPIASVVVEKITRTSPFIYPCSIARRWAGVRSALWNATPCERVWRSERIRKLGSSPSSWLSVARASSQLTAAASLKAACKVSRRDLRKMSLRLLSCFKNWIRLSARPSWSSGRSNFSRPSRPLLKLRK